MKKNEVSLFDKENIDRLDWPNTSEASHARNLLEPLIKEGVQSFIKNVEAKIYALVIDDLVLPLVQNDYKPHNSYVCSFSSQYLAYAKDEIRRLKKPLLKAGLFPLLKILEKLFKMAHFDKIIYVNNWLISTNLHPSLSSEQIDLIKAFLTKRFPDYTIAFRSINFYDQQLFSEKLKAAGFQLIFSRMIYIFDPRQQENLKSRMFKSDLKLLDQASYKILSNHEIPLEAIPRLQKLYNSLYLDKYSFLNPQLTEKMFELLIKKNIFEFRVIEKQGTIEGVVGYYSRNQTMTSPLFGYDTTKSQNDAYRVISTLLALEAKEQSKILNQSSGASSYKRLRRAKEEIEYNALYFDHLSPMRIRAWKALIFVFNKIGIPILHRLKI